MMQKYMNKQLLLVLVLNVFSYTMTAQSPITEKEKEVKTSGKYLWSYATALKEEMAKETAVTLLFESEEFKNQLKSNGNLNKTAISYIVRPRGNQLMAIAYIDKEDIASSQKPGDNKKSEKTSTEKVTKTGNSYINTVVTDNSSNAISSTVPVNEVMTSSSKIINTFLKIENLDDLINELYDLKNKGKIMYSVKESAFNNIADCYVIMIDKNNSKITHILDKGNNIRVSLLTSQQINLKEFQLINRFQNIYVYEF